MYPMFRDLVKVSGCGGNGRKNIKYNFKDAVALSRNYDSLHYPNNGTPQGFIFHESRCGSTLAANAFAVVEGTRVFSESAPPRGALNTNDPNAMKDVLYMMSRFAPTYFKFQSVVSFSVQEITAVYPEVPWIFVYRDPVHVMVSQFTGTANHAGKDPRMTPNCARSKGHPYPGVKEMLKLKMGASNTKNVDNENYCAAHLASLCNEAIEGITNSVGMGLPVGYEGLVDKLKDDLMENHFNLKLSKKDKERLVEISGSYSKARMPPDKKIWKSDSERKDADASKKVVEAANAFMMEGFEKLKRLEGL